MARHATVTRVETINDNESITVQQLWAQLIFKNRTGLIRLVLLQLHSIYSHRATIIRSSPDSRYILKLYPHYFYRVIIVFIDFTNKDRKIILSNNQFKDIYYRQWLKNGQSVKKSSSTSIIDSMVLPDQTSSPIFAKNKKNGIPKQKIKH